MEINPLVSSFVDNFLKEMKKSVEKGEEVMPQVVLFARETGGKTAVIPLIGMASFFDSKEGKRKIPIIVKKVWADFAANNSGVSLMAVVMLTDAWAEKVSLPEYERVLKEGRSAPFKPRPGMGETLMALVSLADQELQYHWPYVRGAGEVVFTPEPHVQQSPPTSGSVLMNKLWPL